MPETLTLDLADPATTTAFGHRLAALLFPGAVIAMIGNLGAGKTFLARAIAEGLGADGRAVSSPTFVLIQEYAGRLPIFHFDAYRLHSPSEFFDLGAHEYFEGNGVCLVEWADKVEPCLPGEHLRLTLTATGENSRRIGIEGRGNEYARIVQHLQDSL